MTIDYQVLMAEFPANHDQCDPSNIGKSASCIEKMLHTCNMWVYHHQQHMENNIGFFGKIKIFNSNYVAQKTDKIWKHSSNGICIYNYIRRNYHQGSLAQW